MAIAGLTVFPRFVVSSPADPLPPRDKFDTVRIAIRDASGREWPLVSSLAETFHGAGGTELSHNGRLLAFSARVFPVLDGAHPKSEAPNGLLSAYADGTPAFRRGNRLMLTTISRSPEKASQPPRLLGSAVADSWSPSWSPDDRAIAYYSNEGGAVQVWVYDVASGARRKLSESRIRVEMGSAMDAPCWSHDGSAVFVSKVTSRVHDGAMSRSNPYQDPANPLLDARAWAIETSDRDIASSTLVEIDVQTGREIPLPTNGPINMLHSLSMSPSGRWLAALTDDYKLSVIRLFDRELFPVAEMTALPYGPDDYAAPFWSPKEDLLAYASKDRLMIVDLTHGVSQPRPLAPNLGEIHWHVNNPRWVYDDTLNAPAYTSDGRAILAFALRNDAPELVVVPVDGTAAKEISIRKGLPLDRAEDSQDLRGQVMPIDLLRVRQNEAWQPTKDHVFVKYRDYQTVETIVDDVDLTDGSTKRAAHWHAQFRVVRAARGNDAVVAYEDFSTPGNFFHLSSSLNRQPRPIVPLETDPAMLAFMRNTRLSVFSTLVPYRTGALRQLTAAVIRPGLRESQPGPAIVSIYPGSQGFWEVNRFPDSLEGTSPIPLATYLLNGYSIMLPHALGMRPYRAGSEPVETASLIDSLLPQVYRAACLGLIDDAHLAIVGESQGGHAAVAATTATNLFRAAVSFNGVRLAPVNGLSSLSGDNASSLDTFQFADGLALLLGNAPYFGASRIQTPILLAHGEADPTFHSSELMVDALKHANKVYTFAPYPNLGHDISEWPQRDQVDLAQRVIRFLDENVKKPSFQHWEPATGSQ